MNKKNLAIFKISIVAVVVALLLIFSFISFDGYAGFYNAIQKGTDLQEGLYANYKVVESDDSTDFDDEFNATFLRIKSLVDQKNYQGAYVYKGTDNIIRIETPIIEDSRALLNEIGLGQFKIRTSSSSSGEVIISGDDVEFSVATTSNTTGYWGTYIQFKEEIAEVLSSLTQNASSSEVTLYFYRGDTEDYFFSLPVSSQITNDFLFISSSTGAMTQENAVQLAISISCGSMPTVVKLQGEVSVLNPLNGALLGLSIALGVMTLFALIILGVVYRELGLLSMLSILFYVGGILFLTQAIPVITLNALSLGAMILGLILVFTGNVFILEKIRGEYAIGKKLNTSIKTGYKNSINFIVDIYGAISLISLVSYFAFSGIFKSFAMLLLTGTLLSCLSTLFITFILTESYSNINKNDGKRVNFVREGNVNETEEIA